MIEFAVTVQGQRISCTKVKGELVSGAIGARVRFTWSEEWQQLQRIGVFRAGSIARDVMDLQDECVIPWEVLAQPGQVLMIGVQGVNEEGTAVTPTLEAEMDEILRGADPSDDPSTEPTLPIWKWVKNLLEQVVKKVTKFMGDSDAALDAIIEMQEELLNGFGTLSAADLQQHIENNSNPHSVTPAQIGAAPAGYGLGKQNEVVITSLSALDNTYLNGWYKFQTFNEESIDGHQLGMLYVNSSTSSVEQILVPYRKPYRLIRVYHAEDGWGVWEYENPSMVVGVEYRTTERWWGRAVYTVLCDLGVAANNKAINVDVDIARILRLHAYTSNRIAHHTDSTWMLYVSIDPSNAVFSIECGEDLATYAAQNPEQENVYAQIWYTKEW